MTAHLPGQIIPKCRSRGHSRCASVPLSDRRTLSAVWIVNGFVSLTLRPPIAAGLEGQAANESGGTREGAEMVKGDHQAPPTILVATS